MTTWLTNAHCLHAPAAYGQWEWNAGPHDCTTRTVSTDPSHQPLVLGENQKKSYCRPTTCQGGGQHSDGKEASHRQKTITSQQMSPGDVLKCPCFSQEALWKHSGYLLQSYTHFLQAHLIHTEAGMWLLQLSSEPGGTVPPALVRACPAAFLGGPR